jgi:hypothetical protein
MQRSLSPMTTSANDDRISFAPVLCSEGDRMELGQFQGARLPSRPTEASARCLALYLNSLRMLDLRFAQLVCQRLFMRKSIAEIDTPRPVSPSKPKPSSLPISWGSTMCDFSRDSPATCGSRGGRPPPATRWARRNPRPCRDRHDASLY